MDCRVNDNVSIMLVSRIDVTMMVSKRQYHINGDDNDDVGGKDEADITCGKGSIYYICGRENFFEGGCLLLSYQIMILIPLETLVKCKTNSRVRDTLTAHIGSCFFI